MRVEEEIPGSLSTLGEGIHTGVENSKPSWKQGGLGVAPAQWVTPEQAIPLLNPGRAQ